MASGGDNVKQELVSKAKESIVDSKNRENQNFAVHLIEKYGLHKDIELEKVCLELCENKNIEVIGRLLGKDSKVENKSEVQHKLIENLLANFNKNSKVAEDLCEKFGVPLEKYPQLKDNKIRNSVRFFLGKYLKKSEKDKEYMGLDHIESLFKGLPECLVHLCEQLLKANKKMEAKGVFKRNNLKIG